MGRDISIIYSVGIIWLALFNSIQTGNAKPPVKSVNCPFLFLLEGQTKNDSFGMVMICPAHAHGTPAEAMGKLKNILQNRPENKISSIWVCRANQIQTLREFAPLVNRVVINPFATTDQKGPDPNDLIWPGFDHPFINHIRRIRQNAKDTALLACIDLRGEPICFRKRQASFEEIEWMHYAVIGANFQGVVWRDSTPSNHRLRRLETNLQEYAGELAKAKPVRWVKTSPGQPVTASGSKKMLFVVLSDPNYMVFSQDSKNKKTILLPLNLSESTGTLELQPPLHIDILSGNTISGLPLDLEYSEKSLRVNYHYKGGGEILVFFLSRNADFDSDQIDQQGEGPVEE